MEVRRGDLVTAAIPGDYGEPRPAVVIQDDAFDALPSVTVLPLTGDLRNSPLVRITVDPSPQNGLERRSQIMVDKSATIARPKIGRTIGRLDRATMDAVDTALARFLGLA
jgi:mRNA interferase MazF